LIDFARTNTSWLKQTPVAETFKTRRIAYNESALTSTADMALCRIKRRDGPVATDL